MPFKSEAQRRWLWRNHPEVAKKWQKKYGTGSYTRPERETNYEGKSPARGTYKPSYHKRGTYRAYRSAKHNANYDEQTPKRGNYKMEKPTTNYGGQAPEKGTYFYEGPGKSMIKGNFRNWKQKGKPRRGHYDISKGGSNYKQAVNRGNWRSRTAPARGSFNVQVRGGTPAGKADYRDIARKAINARRAKKAA